MLHDFMQTYLVSRQTGNLEASTNFGGYAVYRDLMVLSTHVREGPAQIIRFESPQ
jgi:hypothetical protein